MHAGKVLRCRRALGKASAGLWEFPGGKVEAAETPEQALVREIQEELGVPILIGDLVLRASHRSRVGRDVGLTDANPSPSLTQTVMPRLTQSSTRSGVGMPGSRTDGRRSLVCWSTHPPRCHV